MAHCKPPRWAVVKQFPTYFLHGILACVLYRRRGKKPLKMDEHSLGHRFKKHFFKDITFLKFRYFRLTHPKQQDNKAPTKLPHMLPGKASWNSLHPLQEVLGGCLHCNELIIACQWFLKAYFPSSGGCCRNTPTCNVGTRQELELSGALLA